MKMSPSRRNLGLVWAALGGAVLLIAVVAIVIGMSSGATQTPTPNIPSAPPTSTQNTPGSSSTTEPSAGDSVDASVRELGWVAEPITRDGDVYVRAALSAASTFDTQLAVRDQWLSFLDSWFTPDTRYATADQTAELESARLELRQSVVLPESEWESLDSEAGRVVATVNGPIDFQVVPDDESGDMSIGTADVVLMITRTDGSDGELSYEDTVRVSVQVLCGAGSVPTPDSAQQAGDCKVVRFFPEPLEP
ncbi:hypothetical protein [Microbacterium sp. T2.11-28]|jgi:hypothetical protein|uniref:hypothetical protein n=1 Tax=Microbacterium sp. T2.11-28 TaxID=3041169 RepID=UPI00247743C5|nr:hypothetical protein [Microbacterium sp. T2.11-28]CAI9394059.1 hypothetical protein MICABA_02661 [Microbacterium sp. T2.11-28]